MKKRLGILRKRAGTTLVEMVASMLVAELVAVMMIGTLSPAAKIFLRIQRQQFAEMILDNVTEEIKTQLLNAEGSIQLYADGVWDAPGDFGSYLEFMNKDGYIVLMSSEGCEATEIYRGGQKVDDSEAVSEGRLLMRYYWPQMNQEENTYSYIYQKGDMPIARAVHQVFTDGYYMGNYVKITFRLPEGTAVGGEVTHLTAEVGIYSDQERTKKLAEDEVLLHIRYHTKRMNRGTAVIGTP